MEELIILNEQDRAELVNLFIDFLLADSQLEEFEILWKLEEKLLTEDEMVEVAKRSAERLFG